MRNCPHCHARLRHQRSALHLSGDCTSAWYQRRQAKHSRVQGRPAEWDWTPEQIERIMQRRALEQRYERATQLTKGECP